MALNLDHALPNGLDIEYWRVTGEIRIDYDARTIHFVLVGYKDKQTSKKAPQAPGTTRDIRMKGDEFEKNFLPRDRKENLLALCYAAAKVVAADPFFKVGRRKSEVGGRKSEVGSRSRKSEVGSRKSEVGGRRTEDRGRRSEVGSRGRKSEVGNRRLDCGTRSVFSP